MNVLEVMRPA